MNSYQRYKQGRSSLNALEEECLKEYSWKEFVLFGERYLAMRAYVLLHKCSLKDAHEAVIAEMKKD